MVRLARVVVPGLPHHITQRGNRRQETFFCVEDYQEYLALIGEWYRACAVEVWAYCLMPNHVHLIAVPESADGLRRAIGEAHRRYTRRMNFREGWRGHLWQGRFASWVCDIFVDREIQPAARASQNSSHRPLRSAQRRAMMALAPRTVQRMPDCFSRNPTTVLQPASTTPDPTNRPWLRKRA